MINDKYWEILEKKSQPIIKKDRDKFTIYINIINQFINKYNLLHSIIDDKIYIFSNNSEENGKKLIQFFKDHIVDSYIIQLREMFGNIFSFSINFRVMLEFHQYYDFLNKNYKNLTPYKNNQFINDVILIKKYHELYNIENYNNWENILQDINKITPEYELLLNKNIKEGGNAPIFEKFTDNIDINILLNFLHKKDVIFLNNITNIFPSRIEIISLIEFDSFKTELDNFFKELNYTFKFISNKVYIPFDIRLKKATFYLIKDGEKEGTPVIDIYNSGTFELIPYEKFTLNNFVGYKADKEVMIRFLYIKMYILYILKQLNTNNIKYIYNEISELKQKIDISKKKKYLGIYNNLSIYQKIIQKKYPIIITDFNKI